MLRIPLKNPYYDSYDVVVDVVRQTQSNLYEDDEIRLKVVNEDFKNMEPNKWHLLPQAYMIELVLEKKKVEKDFSISIFDFEDIP